MTSSWQLIARTSPLWRGPGSIHGFTPDRLLRKQRDQTSGAFFRRAHLCYAISAPHVESALDRKHPFVCCSYLPRLTNRPLFVKPIRQPGFCLQGLISQQYTFKFTGRLLTPTLTFIENPGSFKITLNSSWNVNVTASTGYHSEGLFCYEQQDPC